MRIDEAIKIKKGTSTYRAIKDAARKVAKWPKWKRAIRVTKYSKGV